MPSKLVTAHMQTLLIELLVPDSQTADTDSQPMSCSTFPKRKAVVPIFVASSCHSVVNAQNIAASRIGHLKHLNFFKKLVSAGSDRQILKHCHIIHMKAKKESHAKHIHAAKIDHLLKNLSFDKATSFSQALPAWHRWSPINYFSFITRKNFRNRNFEAFTYYACEKKQNKPWNTLALSKLTECHLFLTAATGVQ